MEGFLGEPKSVREKERRKWWGREFAPASVCLPAAVRRVEAWG